MTLFEDIQKKFDGVREDLEAAQNIVREQQEHFLSMLKQLDLSSIETDSLSRFMKKPYILRPHRKDVWELIIPKFIKFAAGWPVRMDGEYAVYHVSRFIDLITPLPEWLRKEMGMQKPAFRAHVEDGYVHVDQGNPEEVYNLLGRSKFISSRDGKKLRISPKSQFEILRQLIRQGILPYAPKPIRADLLRTPKADFELRPNQARDFETFKQYSSASVFANGGAGKTFFGMWAIASLKGRKVIIAPRTSILQQWEARIITHLGAEALKDVELRTYQSLSKRPITGKFSLVIFEEIQHLPADMGMRASQIDAETRIGLSATPWREDGNEDLIPALCGVPVGMDWPTGEPPDTTIWLLSGFDEKIALARTLTNKPIDGKTILFVYRIAEGERLSRALRVPFINGGSRQQFKQIQNSDTFVISKVGDMGISIDARRIIEVDWLGGRAEMGQRGLRGQHAKEKGEFHILMTPTEYKANQKRISALYALNFDVRVKGA